MRKIVYISAVLLCSCALLLSQIMQPARKPCSDPAVSPLKVSKTLVNGVGTVTLQTQVCNKGATDLPRMPLVVTLIAQTWHPPRTAAQEGNTVEVSHTPVNTPLKKGECRDITLKYEIPSVIEWEGLPMVKKVARATHLPRHVQAVKDLTVRVEKQPGTNVGLTNAENCDRANDNASIVIKYMEKVK